MEPSLNAGTGSSFQIQAPSCTTLCTNTSWFFFFPEPWYNFKRKGRAYDFLPTIADSLMVRTVSWWVSDGILNPIHQRTELKPSLPFFPSNKWKNASLGNLDLTNHSPAFTTHPLSRHKGPSLSMQQAVKCHFSKILFSLVWLTGDNCRHTSTLD